MLANRLIDKRQLEIVNAPAALNQNIPTTYAMASFQYVIQGNPTCFSFCFLVESKHKKADR
jgi:hypothetical protein